jgi:hypothetical protein
VIAAWCYERAGYRAEAVLQDFFAPGDDKIIYSKPVDTPAPENSLPQSNVTGS